jgi:REP element-mobilizing transposase RayT
MRAQGIFLAFCRALRKTARSWFRLVHFSVQRDHAHLIVEADDRVAFARGMTGLMVRLARAYNHAVRRRGRLWADRFHSRALQTPREMRNCLVYVLLNFKKHEHRAAGAGTASVDFFSSGWWFHGWTEPPGSLPPELPQCSPLMPSTTWLGAVGGMRHGKLGLSEGPRAAARGAGLAW